MLNPSNPYGSRGSVMDLLAGGSRQHQFVVSRRRTRFGDCLWSPASAWCYA
ncbi:nodulation protein NodZ [Mesorhizobium helmanticense]